MKNFIQERYFDNLKVQGTDVISYVTKVAEIDHKNEQVIRLGWWSPTTSKHINYVAEQLDYNIIDVEDVEMDEVAEPPKRKTASEKIIIEYGIDN